MYRLEVSPNLICFTKISAQFLIFHYKFNYSV
jgi:hypothetical protein